MSKKVLIVYATGGMGHVMAAKAVEQAFAAKYPDIEVKNIDVITFANPFYRFFFVDGYNYVSSKLPKLWGMLYKGFNNKSSQTLPNLISRWAISRRFIPFIETFKPDFIISAHPLPMALVSASKREHLISIMSSIVVTDFGCHSFWVDKEVNYYFVATENVDLCLRNYGVMPQQVVTTGIPIELKFTKDYDRAALLQKMNLLPELPTVLIVGGQFDFAALQNIIGGVKEKHDGKVQFIVVAGRDKVLEEALNNSDLGKDERIKVFGFVSNMEEMMSAADVMFSKAGGLTVSECLAKGLPMVINKVIPGQEEDNVEYLTSKGAALRANSFEEIIAILNDLLANPQKLEAMKKAAKGIGKPYSATTLADFVVEKINK